MITREEFELILKQTFDWKRFCTNDPLTCLVTADEQKILEMQNIMSSCTSRIDFYLTEWDNAQTPEAKMAVVGSVQGTIS
jgi:hypothetical protein